MLQDSVQAEKAVGKPASIKILENRMRIASYFWYQHLNGLVEFCMYPHIPGDFHRTGILCGDGFSRIQVHPSDKIKTES